MPPHRGAKKPSPQHRVYPPGKRHMELIASVSRSSGLEKDGDALRDPRIQEEYRVFIQEKVDDYWRKYQYPRRTHHPSPQDAQSLRNMRETEENLLILFRKLREGLLSTQRRDAFALEVYETSLHLSILFRSPAQTTSTLSHLFPDFYIHPLPIQAQVLNSTPSPSLTNNRSNDSSSQQAHPSIAIAPSALSTTLIFLLHHLVTSYPSQIVFHTQLRQLHPSLQDALRAPLTLHAPGAPSSSSISSTQSHPQLGTTSPPSSSAHAQPSSQPPAPSPPSSSSPSQLTPSHRHRLAEPMPVSMFTVAAAAEDASSTRTRTGGGQAYTRASAYDWLRDLARGLRERNYARLDALTRRETFGCFLQVLEPISSIGIRASGPVDVDKPGLDPSESQSQSDLREREVERSLALEAVGVLVETLLEKARGRTWDVLRTAYREVSLRAVVSGSVGAGKSGTGTTGEWLARSLVLVNPSAGARTVSWGRRTAIGKDDVEEVEAWLDERRGRGEARRKEGEGTDGRWILVKA